MAGTSAKKAVTLKTNGAVAPDNRGKIKSDFPKNTLQEAIRVPSQIYDKNGGRPLPPLETAEALGMSPGSSDFRTLLSSSIKYGLTAGSFNGERVSLEATGRSIVEAKSEEERQSALIGAALTPVTFKSIYDSFKSKKIPEQKFFENALVRDFGVPREHATRCVEIFLANVKHVGLVKTLPSGAWLSADYTPSSPVSVEAEEDDNGIAEEVVAKAATLSVPKTVTPPSSSPIPTGKMKVIIAHGKNLEVVRQLKDLLTFGDFEPVVATEHETIAKPLPEKVLDDMKASAAGIIHVASEDELLDKQGGVHHKLNDNVLIEIGAAMALFNKKFILLVQKGLHLPSNLDGLYCCYYEGDKLDYDATMKLLKTFSEFRKVGS